jgi:aminopeptidase N
MMYNLPASLGYYRVNYNIENWLSLGAALIANHSGIPRVNTAQILEDSFNLARANQERD